VVTPTRRRVFPSVASSDAPRHAPPEEDELPPEDALVLEDPVWLAPEDELLLEDVL